MQELSSITKNGLAFVRSLSKLALDCLGEGNREEFVIGGKKPFSYTQVRRMCERNRAGLRRWMTKKVLEKLPEKREVIEMQVLTPNPAKIAYKQEKILHF
ncbi:MAG: hypothetical protein RR482_02675 [Clostridia bacterium]